MKYLLHSRKFKVNLMKWLFMYCCVIGLFTVVVTYSRYITSKTVGVSSRIAQFDVTVTYDGVCSGTDTYSTCSLGEIRPVSTLDYYFTVDTTKLEVDTFFETTITVNPAFDNYRLFDVTNGTSIPYVNGSNYHINGNKIIITEDIEASSGYVRTYKLTVHYKNEQTYNQPFNYQDSVVVDYSAIQK